MEQEPKQPLPDQPPASPDAETPLHAVGGAEPAVPGPSPAPNSDVPERVQHPMYPPYAPPMQYAPPGGYPPPGAYAPPPQYPAPGQYAAWGSYPAYGWQPPQSPPAPKRGAPVGLILLLVGLAVVVIAAGIGGTLALTRGARNLASRAGPATAATATATDAPPNWLDFKDPLNGVVGYEWPQNSYCYFQNGAYHINPGTVYGHYLCFATRAGNFSDFDMHVTVEEQSGPLNNGCGLVFRATDLNHFYVFVVDSNGKAWVSKWVFDKRDQLSPTWTVPRFTSGLHTPHVLRVTAEGSIFSFYVDGDDVGWVTDTTFTDGRVGLFSGGSQLDAAFTSFEVDGAE